MNDQEAVETNQRSPSEIHFMNKGEFDVSAMLTFGVSAKASDNAIGQFGTGFKYAIAIVLRLGGTISVKSNDNIYLFTAQTRNIRGKDFDIVFVNGREAGFTTHLGAHWEPWQAFRELYSNCMDEDGVVSETAGQYETIVSVDCHEVYNAYINKKEYFISGAPVMDYSHVQIFEGGSQFLYYKGVAVANSEESDYSFNVLSNVDLTEDRTAHYPDYDICNPIARAIQSCTDKSLIRHMLLSKKKFERNMPYQKQQNISKEFISTCRELLDTDQGIPLKAMSIIREIDQKNSGYPEIAITSVQQGMLDKATDFLRKINITIDDFPIKVVRGLGENTMGLAHNGEIYLSLIPFDQGTKQVASTVLEEFVHLKHNVKDFDRKMQSWLFDKILSIGEEINGEAL